MSHRRPEAPSLTAALAFAAFVALSLPATAAAQVPAVVEERGPAPAAQGSAPGAAPGSAQDVYTVRDVDVDVTAASAAAARDEAITEAQRKAFQQLVRRLTPEGTPVPTVTDAQVAPLVQDFEVQRERSSSVRYLATFTVRFRPNAVRSLLQEGGVAFAEARSKPVLVLPVYRAADAEPVLWEDRTPWRDAWENTSPNAGLVPVVVPYGELADIADVSAEEALQGDSDGFASIAERYGAADVLVAELAVPAGGPDPASAGRVTVTRYTPGGPLSPMTVTVPAAPDGTVEEYLAGGVAAVNAILEGQWKEETAIDRRDERRMEVTVPIARLEDWIRTRRQITQVPSVARADLRRLTRQGAEVELVYYGDTERLRSALARQDLQLERAEPTVPFAQVPSAPVPPGMPALPVLPVQPGGGPWRLYPAGSVSQ